MGKIVCWPESQNLMDKEGFNENATLINSQKGIDTYGYQAYKVDEEWLEKVNKGEVRTLSEEELENLDNDEMSVDCGDFDDYDDDEEKTHICPECGSTNTRLYFDADPDEEGWVCEDCGFQGSEEEFLDE